jgi:hypothetical protein
MALRAPHCLSRPRLHARRDRSLNLAVRTTISAASVPPARSSKAHIPTESTGMPVAEIERLWRRLEPLWVAV